MFKKGVRLSQSDYYTTHSIRSIVSKRGANKGVEMTPLGTSSHWVKLPRCASHVLSELSME